MEEHQIPLKNIVNVLGIMGTCARKEKLKNEDAALHVSTFVDNTEKVNSIRMTSEIDFLEPTSITESLTEASEQDDSRENVSGSYRREDSLKAKQIANVDVDFKKNSINTKNDHEGIQNSERNCDANSISLNASENNFHSSEVSNLPLQAIENSSKNESVLHDDLEDIKRPISSPPALQESTKPKRLKVGNSNEKIVVEIDLTIDDPSREVKKTENFVSSVCIGTMETCARKEKLKNEDAALHVSTFVDNTEKMSSIQMTSEIGLLEPTSITESLTEAGEQDDSRENVIASHYQEDLLKAKQVANVDVDSKKNSINTNNDHKGKQNSGKDCDTNCISLDAPENKFHSSEVLNLPLKAIENSSKNESVVCHDLENIKRPTSSPPALHEGAKPKRLKVHSSSEKIVVEIDLTKDDPIRHVKKLENFVSDDPKENDDNNNPEWEVLKKLETDDERYKAVRKRWRNLVIPDPNKNLTCIHIKSAFKHPVFSQIGHNDREDTTTRNSRKRTFSCEPSSSTGHVPVKRARTRSCTTSYDIKVQNHYKEMEEEEKKLRHLKSDALANSNKYYNRQHWLLTSSLQYYDSWEFRARIALLQAQQREAEAAVHRQFSGAMDRLQGEKHRKALMFKKAMKEVEAFHRFYRKLDERCVKNDCFFLTDVELDDVFETDELYEKFEKFYNA